MKRHALLLIALVGAVLSPDATLRAAEEEETLAIIVHVDSDIRELSRSTLQRLFKGQLQTNREVLPGSSAPIHRVQLVLAQPAQDAFLREYVEMSARSYWRYWAGLVLAGENIRPPLKDNKGSDAVERVAADEELIGVVWASEATEEVRVVSISR